MSAALAEIGEREASGRVAALYAEIRATQGLPLVNLVWRHLATEPDALEWAWRAARPLYASGAAAAQARALVAALDLPVVAPLPDHIGTLLGLAAGDRERIAAVIAAYNRGNGLNLVALSALLAEPGDESPPAPGIAQPSASGAELPPIPALAALDGATRETVLALNRLGSPPDTTIVASLYRHLAHWPGYLAYAWTVLDPLERDGRIASASATVGASARRYGARAARQRGPVPDAPVARWVVGVLETFVAQAIARMVPIGLMLARGLEPEQSR